MDPSGIRIGTAALTTRGFSQDELREIGNMISTVLEKSEQPQILEQVRQNIKQMTEAHPLYNGWTIL